MDYVNIKTASISDAEEILKIYAPYVEKTAVTFEYSVPSLKEFKNRMEKTLQYYPYIVAVEGNEILGYAYTGAFVGRAAYGWAAETTIYLKENRRNMGLGKRLCQAIEEISKEQNILNLYACISCPITEDEYLTKNSIQFHAHMGYRLIGEFHKCGYKFGRWYNMVWMEKIIGEHPSVPAPVIPFPDLNMETLPELCRLLRRKS